MDRTFTADAEVVDFEFSANFDQTRYDRVEDEREPDETDTEDLEKIERIFREAIQFI
jgi:hypothetical protein